jgi:hypothetical protein
MMSAMAKAMKTFYTRKYFSDDLEPFHNGTDNSTPVISVLFSYGVFNDAVSCVDYTYIAPNKIIIIVEQRIGDDAEAKGRRLIYGITPITA